MMTLPWKSESTPEADLEARLDETKNSSRGWTRTLCFALSAVFLLHALDLSWGFFSLEALGYASLSFVWCLIAVAAPRLEWLQSRTRLCKQLVHWILQIAVWTQLLLLATRIPGYLKPPASPRDLDFFHGGAGVVLLLTLAFSLPRFRFERVVFPLILLGHFCLGLWMIHHYPKPGIDVFVIQNDAAKALLHGINPYTITFPDPYLSKSSYYASGLSVGGRLMTGYVYPPLSVLMALPGSLLGDVRYSNLMAITGTGALLAYARPNRFSFLAATLFLFMPQVFFILVLCWTDAFVALLLAGVLFAACRAPRFLALAIGLLMAVKQYLFLSAPLLFLLVPQPARNERNSKPLWKLLGQSALVALIVSLPLILWNPQAYLRSAILLNFNNPFRTDSLNYAALWFRITGDQPSSLLGFVLLIPAYWLILRRSSRTPGGFAGATALFYFVFFLFGRQAFINYYFVIFAALCGAIAVFDEGSKDEAREESHDAAIS